MKYLLDSCIIISLLMGEKEASKIEQLFNEKSNQFYMNYINYGEVLYIVGKKVSNKEKYNKIKNYLKNYLNIKFIKTDDFDTIEAAASTKIDGGLAYFDALVLAASKKENLTILTKDKEFKRFEKTYKIEFI